MTNDTSSPASKHCRSTLLAVLLSAAATGLGHIYCGRLLKGLILFFASFVFAPVIVVAAQNANSAFMLVVVAGSVMLLVGVFFYALVDAGLLARRLRQGYQPKEYNRWYIYLLFIVVALSYPTNLASSVRDHLLQAFKIPAPSMAPAILKGDRILLNKAIYKIKAPRRGDVVVFIYPDDRRLFYIKRIVAMPGDSVEIRGNKILVNDQPLAYKAVTPTPEMNLNLGETVLVRQENNHGRRYPVMVDSANMESMPKTTVPHGTCFVLGDNRGNSKDSRTFGPVPLADVLGRVDFIYWPALNWSRFGKFQY